MKNMAHHKDVLYKFILEAWILFKFGKELKILANNHDKIYIRKQIFVDTVVKPKTNEQETDELKGKLLYIYIFRYYLMSITADCNRFIGSLSL